MNWYLEGSQSYYYILDTDPDIRVSVTYKEYYKRLEQGLKYLQKVLLDFKMRQLALLNKDRQCL